MRPEFTHAGLLEWLGNRESRNVPGLRATYVELAGERTQPKHLRPIWLRYHYTPVAILDADGAITIDAGGWKTCTTKARINMVLGLIGRWVVQRDFRWFIRSSRGRVMGWDGTPVRLYPGDI